MTSIVVSVNTWRQFNNDADEDGGRWSYRGTYSGGVSNVNARTLREGEDENSYHYGESWQGDLDVLPGDFVYPVVVSYTSGDTFGSSGGYIQILDVFTDANREKAYELVRQARSFTNKDDSYTLKFDGKEYSVNWVGYFDRLDDVDVHPVRIGI